MLILQSEGGRGFSPYASQFLQISILGNSVKKLPVDVHRQCLLFLSIILDKNSYPDFLIIPTISEKADNYGLLLKKGRDNFFIKGRYLTARMQMF